MWPFTKSSQVVERKEPTLIRKQSTVSKAVRLAHSGAWDAAQPDRLISGWVTGTQPINQQIESELRNLRARSRNLAHNDPYIRRFLSMCRNNVVGSKGFILRSQVSYQGKPDIEARDAIEKAWNEFSRPGVCDAQNRLSMKDMDNMMVDSLNREGEIIVMVVTGKAENKFGVSFKLIDPELLDVNIKDVNGKNKVRMGIETDSRGRVAAYHFHSTDVTHSNYYNQGGVGYLRIKAEFIIHKFIFEYPDQLRGYPRAAAAMLRLRILNGYEEAELVAARNAASTMGFIVPNGDDAGFEGDEDTYETDEEDDDVEYVDEDPIIEAEAGAFHYLAPGADIKQWSAPHPNQAYQAFVKTILRGIASALNVDYNTLANDLEGVNFSSLRGGVLESRELWKCLQEFFIEHIKSTMFNTWLKWALLNEAVVWNSGKPLSSSKLTQYSDHTFQGRRWDWVDPYKDTQTAKLNVDEKFKSRSQVIREMGGDPDEVWQEIAEEQKRLKELGIEIVSKPTQSIVKPESEPEPEQSDEEDDEKTKK
jgi:lambda family phage portal protein